MRTRARFLNSAKLVNEVKPIVKVAVGMRREKIKAAANARLEKGFESGDQTTCLSKKNSVVGRSARHSRRAPSGAVRSFVLPDHAFGASSRYLRASIETRQERRNWFWNA